MLYLRDKQFSRGSLTRQISAFRIILSQFGNSGLNEFTKDLLLQIKQYVLQNAPSQTTAHKKLGILRSVLNWSCANGFCDAVNFPVLPAINYKHFIPPVAEELSGMLAVAPPHIARVIILGSQCGVRVGPSEMFNLTWQDVYFKRCVLTVPGAKKILHAPGGKFPWDVPSLNF